MCFERNSEKEGVVFINKSSSKGKTMCTSLQRLGLFLTKTEATGFCLVPLFTKNKTVRIKPYWILPNQSCSMTSQSREEKNVSAMIWSDRQKWQQGNATEMQVKNRKEWARTKQRWFLFCFLIVILEWHIMGFQTHWISDETR